MLDGDVQSLRASVQGGILQADITDGGGVDQRHQLANVVHEEAVEKVGALVLEVGQVQVLVDVGLSGVDHLHGTLALSLKRLHGMRQEASEISGDTLLGSEGQT